MKHKDLSFVIKENKTVFIIIALGLFLLELEIFALAAGKSGSTSFVRVIDVKGNLIHEARGQRLADSDIGYIEKTFGPIDRFDIQLVKQEIPFPFRAWFTSAVGIPVAVILLFSFFVKVYSSLFYSGETIEPDITQAGGVYLNESKLDKVFNRISRYNIYTIGFLIFLAVFAYWMVPNVFSYLGNAGIEMVIQYKWFFITVSAIFLGLVIWIIYLRYLLAKRAMDGRMEVEKYRLSLEYQGRTEPLAQLGYDGENIGESPPKTLNIS